MGIKSPFGKAKKSQGAVSFLELIHKFGKAQDAVPSQEANMLRMEILQRNEVSFQHRILLALYHTMIGEHPDPCVPPAMAPEAIQRAEGCR
jgi:hypothetical protein